MSVPCKYPNYPQSHVSRSRLHRPLSNAFRSTRPNLTSDSVASFISDHLQNHGLYWGFFSIHRMCWLSPPSHQVYCPTPRPRHWNNSATCNCLPIASAKTRTNSGITLFPRLDGGTTASRSSGVGNRPPGTFLMPFFPSPFPPPGDVGRLRVVEDLLSSLPRHIHTYGHLSSLSTVLKTLGSPQPYRFELRNLSALHQSGISRLRF